VPGVITAGTFYQDGKRVFWDVHHPEKAIVAANPLPNSGDYVIREQAFSLLVHSIRVVVGARGYHSSVERRHAHHHIAAISAHEKSRIRTISRLNDCNHHKYPYS